MKTIIIVLILILFCNNNIQCNQQINNSSIFKKLKELQNDINNVNIKKLSMYIDINILQIGFIDYLNNACNNFNNNNIITNEVIIQYIECIFMHDLKNALNNLVIDSIENNFYIKTKDDRDSTIIEYEYSMKLTMENNNIFIIISVFDKYIESNGDFLDSQIVFYFRMKGNHLLLYDIMLAG